MKSLLLISIAFIVANGQLVAQASTSQETNVSVIASEKDANAKVKNEIEVVKNNNGDSSSGQISIKSTSKDGKQIEKLIDFKSMSDNEINRLIDSLINNQLDGKNIDINVSSDSKIKIIQIPSETSENSLFQEFDFEKGINWIDIEDILEIEEIQKADKIKPFLGVILDDEIETEKGVKILSLVENGSAQAAGVAKNDILVALDSFDINSIKDIGAVLCKKKVGEDIAIHVMRDGQKLVFQANLKSRAECNYNLSNSFNFKMPSCCKGEHSCDHHKRTYKAYAVKPRPKLGVNISDLDAEMISDLKITNGKGVLVTKIYDASSADKLGLKINDVIIKINDVDITNSEDLLNFLSQQEIGNDITISFMRYGNLKTVDGKLTEFDNFHFNFNN